MGPPKIKQRKLPYSEKKRRYDHFEYRWDSNNNAFYLFNPYTGETIMSANVELVHRLTSLWAPPEKYPSTHAETIQLLPEWYLSRRWGRRRFNGWASADAAAVHMTAIARGFLTRLWLKRYYQSRYYKVLDSTGYYYFIDTYYPDQEAKWYKPLLAFPDDIQPLEVENPNDYLKGKKFSKSSFDQGPFLKVCGLSKHDVGRAECDSFLIPNPIRDHALKHYEDIDLDYLPLGEVVAWMDSDKLSSLVLNEFHYIRAAICHNNWDRVLSIMKEHPENLNIQIFGFHSFSKTTVPMDVSGYIDYSTAKVMTLCAEVIEDTENIYHPLIKLSALKAFHNIVSERPARAEYLSTEKVREQGPARDTAIEEFYKKRLNIFSKYLTNINTETYNVYNKGEKNPHQETKPMPRSIELVEAALRCLCQLAQERESKEILALLIMDGLIFALEVCEEEALVIFHGLQLMYNLCYRCEPGQQAILVGCNIQAFLERVHYHHSGDPDVMRQCHRLELALQPNGFRGNVEQVITQEMYAEQARVAKMKSHWHGGEEEGEKECEEENKGKDNDDYLDFDLESYHSSSEYK